MTAAKRVRRRSVQAKRSKSLRYTVDASVFVHAFNPHEEGHAESLQILASTGRARSPGGVPAGGDGRCLMQRQGIFSTSRVG